MLTCPKHNRCASFPARSLRSTLAGAVSLSGYLRFWGWTYLAITVAVSLLTKERSCFKGGGASGGATAGGGANGSSGKANGASCGDAGAGLLPVGSGLVTWIDATPHGLLSPRFRHSHVTSVSTLGWLIDLFHFASLIFGLNSWRTQGGGMVAR